VIVDNSRHYYFVDEHASANPAPSYTLKPDEAKDSWYFSTMAAKAGYNINVNYDRELKVTKVWLNVVAKADGKPIGLCGTGLDLSTFLHDFVVTREAGVTPMILDAQAAIQAHPDPRLIVMNTATGHATSSQTALDLLDDEPSRQAMHAVMQDAMQHPANVATGWVSMNGRRQLLAVGYLPELNWFIATAVDLGAAGVVDANWLRLSLLAVGLLVSALLIGFAAAIDRLIIKPLKHLHRSAGAIASGNYAVDLPPGGGDEIGELSQAFGAMAVKVRSHTQELESKVRERTAALVDANQRMASAHKQLDDSISYASLIQRAILPDRDLVQSLGSHHFVLWRPRDVVGGDFYVFRADGDNCLVGVIDCAGHGVPGALMTMLARAAVDQAITAVGPGSPAAILAQTDSVVRTMLRDGDLPPAIATSMDAGLCYVDRGTGSLRFAGARLSLFWSDGEVVEEVKGDRRALGDRRIGEYHDVEVPLSTERTYYLVTDGILDQAGGEHGFGLGTDRLRALLRDHARMPMQAQANAFVDALSRYQGGLPQRDDMTMLSFRFD
jgi:serine phosphatase RsbU (regulator of sigma subunit)